MLVKKNKFIFVYNKVIYSKGSLKDAQGINHFKNPGYIRCKKYNLSFILLSRGMTVAFMPFDSVSWEVLRSNHGLTTACTKER